MIYAGILQLLTTELDIVFVIAMMMHLAQDVD